jgi:hypothetical protein
MSDEELKHVWHQPSHQQKIQFNQNLLQMELEDKLAGIEKQIWQRDRREILSALAVIAFFGLFSFFTQSLQARIGCGIIIASCVWIVYTLKSAPRTTEEDRVALPLQAYLNAVRTSLLRQQALLTTVWYWYLLPPFIGIVVFISGLQASTYFQLIYYPALCLLYLAIYRLNKKAAGELQVYITRIDENLSRLQENGTRS